MFYDHDPAVQIYLEKLNVELNKIINEENGSFQQSLSSTQIWIYFSNKQLPDKEVEDDDDDDINIGTGTGTGIGKRRAGAGAGASGTGETDIINRNVTLVSTSAKNSLFIKLCNALSEDSTVKQLYLINYFHFPKEPIYIKHLRDSINHQSCALQFLHLGQLNINDICIQLLFPTIQKSTDDNEDDEDEYDEDGNPITNTNTNDIIPFGPNLQEIYLPYNNITDIGVSYIDEYLLKSHEKIRVVMWHNPASVRCLYVNDNYEVIKEYTTTATTKQEEETSTVKRKKRQNKDNHEEVEKNNEDEAHDIDEELEQVANI